MALKVGRKMHHSQKQKIEEEKKDDKWSAKIEETNKII